MHKIVIGFAALLLSIPLIHCSSHKTRTWHSKAGGPELVPEKTRQVVETIISHGKNMESSARLSIAYPYDRTVFPPEIAAPEVWHGRMLTDQLNAGWSRLNSATEPVRYTR